MAYIGKQPKKLGAGDDLPSQAGQSGKFLKSDGTNYSWADSDGSPSIVDNGNATAITIDSSENVTLTGDLWTQNGGKVHFWTSGNDYIGLDTWKATGSNGLHINSTSSSGKFKVSVAGTERLRIDSSGNVLVGTSSQSARLMVSEKVNRSLTSAEAQVKIEGSGYTGFLALDGTSFQIGQNSANRSLTFHSGSGMPERLRITSSGNVGIGTTSNASRLTVGSGAGSEAITINAGSGWANLNLKSGSNNGGAIVWNDGADAGEIFYYHGSGGDYMRFNTNGTERLRIDSSGNVGIGETSPAEKLYVAGDIKAHENVFSKGKVIDLTSYDNDTYYPVVITSGHHYNVNNYELCCYYGGGDYNAAVFAKFDFTGFTWGGNPINLYTDFISMNYTNILGALGRVGHYKPCMFLRGGKTYHLRADTPLTIDILTATDSNYNNRNDQYSYSLGPLSLTTMQGKAAYLGYSSGYARAARNWDLNNYS